MRSNATALGSWCKVIRKALDLSGLDGAALVAEAGIDLRQLDEPGARCPVAATARLWTIARRETGDPAFGLKVASLVTGNTFHALGYSIAPSSTLKAAFERMARYAYIFSDAAENRFMRAVDGYHYVLEPHVELPHECVDAIVSLYVRMCRALSDDRSLSPLRIELSRPAPESVGDFERILRTPLHFGAAQNRIVYRHADLERRLDGGNEELAVQHDAIAHRYLALLAKDNIVAQVEAAIVELLPTGEPLQAEVAARLHIGVRTMQRKLAEAELTYSDIVESTRQRLATAYLASRRYSTTEVGYLLGFSDASSFTRAFKRWTGRPPTAFRRGAGAN